MLIQAFAAVGFLCMAIVLLPSKGVRQKMLALMSLAAHGAALAAVAAAALFYFQPAWTPGVFERTIESVSGTLASRTGIESTSAAWMVLAAAVTVASLPALTLLDFSRRLNGVEASAAGRASRKKSRQAERRSVNAEVSEKPSEEKTNGKARKPASRRTVLECLR